MTDRPTASTITDAQLDALYDERDRLREDIEECRAYEQDAHRRAADAAKFAVITCNNHDRLRKEAETALARVRSLADRWDNALAVDKTYARALRAALGDLPPDPAQPTRRAEQPDA